MTDNLVLEQIRFAESKALKISILQTSAISTALHSLGFKKSRPVIVLVGGTGAFQAEERELIHRVMQALFDVAQSTHAAMIDGGTQAGIMAAAGQIHQQGGYDFPLIGVAAEGTVTWPGRKLSVLRKLRRGRSAPLDPHHTHFILVPGKNWGDESSWIAEVASQLAGDQPSVTILINGGKISHDQDVPNNLQSGHSVFVIEGSGGAADEFAANPPDTDRLRFVKINELERLTTELEGILKTAYETIE
jgi:hypothetical protein